MKRNQELIDALNQKRTVHTHINIRSRKKNDDGSVTIRGFANVESKDSKPVIDTYGTVFQASGFRFDEFTQNPIMFWQHDRDVVVGTWDVFEAREEKGVKGLWVEGRIFGDTAMQKDVQAYVLQGSVKTLSIGFEAEEWEEEELPDGTYFIRITRTNLIEISVVTLPSNRESVFSMARAILEGNDLVCPRCLTQPAVLVNVASMEAAARAMRAHATTVRDAGSEDDAQKALAILEDAAKALKAHLPETPEAVVEAAPAGTDEIDLDNYTPEEIEMATQLALEKLKNETA